MATRSLLTNDMVSPFLQTQRTTPHTANPDSPSTTRNRQNTMVHSRSVPDMSTGPAAYGYKSLQNDPRADIGRLTALFDIIDLNKSETVTLDEMQWFLELQGQSVKRTEFQMIVEGMGIVGANAPLTRRSFVEFLLIRLADNPKCTFEVRVADTAPPDAKRVIDASILKKLLAAEAEEKKRKSMQPRKPSQWRGSVTGGKGGGVKTEFMIKTWEELEAISRKIPEMAGLKVAKIENYNPERAEVLRLERGAKTKKKKGKRPETAPAGGREDGNPEEEIGGGGRSALDPYYVKAASLQKDLEAQEGLEVKAGVSLTQQVLDRPSTAQTRGGGAFPYDQEHLSKVQFEQKRNPKADLGEEEEGVREQGSRASERRGSKSSVNKSQNAEMLTISYEDSSLDPLAMKSGKRTESPDNIVGGHNRGSPVISLSVSPSQIRRADEAARVKYAVEAEKQKTVEMLAAKEQAQIKEISTGNITEPKLAKLPPAAVRNHRDSFKKMASQFAVRDRPKSATGRSNGARAALRLQRALEFERVYGKPELNLNRPSTASGV